MQLIIFEQSNSTIGTFPLNGNTKDRMREYHHDEDLPICYLTLIVP